MRLEIFKKLIENMQLNSKRSGELYDFGINLLDYDENFYHIINDLLQESFGEEGKGWIEWYLYDRTSHKSKEPLKAYNEYGKEICHDIESLWETVISANDK